LASKGTTFNIRKSKNIQNLTDRGKKNKKKSQKGRTFKTKTKTGKTEGMLLGKKNHEVKSRRPNTEAKSVRGLREGTANKKGIKTPNGKGKTEIL